MSYTYTHTENLESPSGFITRITDSNGSLVETPSELNNAGTEVDEAKSEKKALGQYHCTIGSVNSQLERVQTIDESQVMDTTYMGGSAARVDYSVSTTQGQAIVTKLQATWPNEVSSYTTHSKNLVAEYTAQRPPYSNDSISFYNFEKPSNAIKARFHAAYDEYLPWYGLKFDTVTETVLAKFVISDKEMKNTDIISWREIHDLLPEWLSYTFFAKIHDKDGNINENVDVYFQADATIVQEWCTANSHTFPYDTDDDTIEPTLFVWGCVFNTSSKEITHVKAYARTTV